MSPAGRRRRSSLARGAVENIEVLGLPKVRRDLELIVERMGNLRPAWAPVVAELEASERALFDSYGGRYVRTGALRASLTEAAGSGAIRRLNRKSLAFGSHVWYGKFQGTTGPGHHRAPSAVLKSNPAVRGLAARSVLEYIVHGSSIGGWAGA